jgi:hypothetical protein
MKAIYETAAVVVCVGSVGHRDRYENQVELHAPLEPGETRPQSLGVLTVSAEVAQLLGSHLYREVRLVIGVDE